MSVIRPTITIGIQPNTRLLRIERIPGEWVATLNKSLSPTGKRWTATVGGAWMVWINSNIDFTQGTFIQLNDDGTIQRVTVEPDGTEDVFDIKKEGD